MSRIPDVIVVGAGGAGLAATSKLADAGLSVTIVEARDRRPDVHLPRPRFPGSDSLGRGIHSWISA